MPRPQFSLRSLFVLTALVAVACWVGAPIIGLVVAIIAFGALWIVALLADPPRKHGD
jgi:O-antigen/teichoic acid export membrane protein